MEVFFVKIWVKTQKKYSDGIWYVIMRPGQPADRSIIEIGTRFCKNHIFTIVKVCLKMWSVHMCVGRTDVAKPGIRSSKMKNVF